MHELRTALERAEALDALEAVANSVASRRPARALVEDLRAAALVAAPAPTLFRALLNALQALKATACGEFAQLRLDECEQARLGDRVDRADHAQVLGMCRKGDSRAGNREQQCGDASPVRRSHGLVR
jgi:hypothetical protein